MHKPERTQLDFQNLASVCRSGSWQKKKIIIISKQCKLDPEAIEIYQVWNPIVPFQTVAFWSKTAINSES